MIGFAIPPNLRLQHPATAFRSRHGELLRMGGALPTRAWSPSRMRSTILVLVLAIAEAAFDDDQEIQVSMNKVWPYSNPTETYEYYDFPFCHPKIVMPHFMTLGQVLRGDRLVNSLYPMHMKRQVPRTVICSRPVSEMDILKFKAASIDQNYMFELFVGELPIASC
eukprot:Skav203825  [mRNA]  locus=scaffold505:213064:223313:- [translate_table: standard]